MLSGHSLLSGAMLWRCVPRGKGNVLTSGDSFSAFVSAVRQPAECFFNWLNRLTDIQTASMVRSLSGLLFHVFGRIAAPLLFKP